MDWQPIETAPKDGTAILVMRDIWPGSKSGRAENCNGHNTYVAEWWDREGPDGKGAWVCYMDAILDPICPIDPTHWMPLPAPPIAAEPHSTPHPTANQAMTELSPAAQAVRRAARRAYWVPDQEAPADPEAIAVAVLRALARQAQWFYSDNTGTVKALMSDDILAIAAELAPSNTPD